MHGNYWNRIKILFQSGWECYLWLLVNATTAKASRAKAAAAASFLPHCCCWWTSATMGISLFWRRCFWQTRRFYISDLIAECECSCELFSPSSYMRDRLIFSMSANYHRGMRCLGFVDLALRAFGTSSMGVSKVFLRHIAPERAREDQNLTTGPHISAEHAQWRYAIAAWGVCI